MMGQPAQVLGTTLANRSYGVQDTNRPYIIQIRRLRMGIGIHEDVAVDRTCYTSGPAEGIYRRDETSSNWALTDADGWSTPPGWSFNVNEYERDMCKTYMDSIAEETMNHDWFTHRLWDYLANGFCLKFSRSQFNFMADWVARMREGTA